MRMIGTVSSEQHAQRFSDYLLSIRVDAHIEESTTGQWQVWVEHDDNLDVAKVELAQFQAQPDDSKYISARSDAQKVRKERDKAAERRRKNFTDVRTSAAWSGLGRRPTPVAMALIAICIALAFLIALGGPSGAALKMTLLFDATPPTITVDPITGNEIEDEPASMFDDIGHGQIWRIITPVLLHGGIIHLVFNMMWLWRFGAVIESAKGSWFLIMLVLVIAAISCTAQAAWYEYVTGWRLFVGFSGVNAGLFGYAWMKHRLQPHEQIFVTDQEIGLMIGWIVICSLGFVDHVANVAHWGGLITGIAIGGAPWLIRRYRRRVL
ncbi:MAG: rhomboid family intramembrane serine protease [Burkholderiales bacterium]|nr:rhomboid family intramembrane serine protease [Phycisphaerae bacterium]